MVNGWGRIFLLYRIEFDTKDKKEWLLNEGYKNSIDNSYTAAYILDVLDTKEIILESKNSNETFVNITNIINAAIKGEPGLPITSVKNYKEIFDTYISLKDTYYEDIFFCYTVSNMYEIEEENYPKALEVLKSEECYNLVKDKINNGSKNEAYISVGDDPHFRLAA